MNILKHEIKTEKLPLIIWSLSIGLLVAACVLMYPSMQSQMDDVNDIFSSMGSFTSAFGMDKLNFGTLKGFYAVEGGNMLGIGGAFFAGIIGVSSLMKEERNHTAEFLLTHPLSRVRIITEKLLSTFALVIILNLIVLLCSICSILMIGEKIFWTELLLFHLAYLLMQFEIVGICFGISAFVNRGGLGIGIGVAGLMYLLNIIANISEDAKVLKYISAFSYTEGADIINEKQINISYLLPGILFMLIGIILAYIRYTKKDIN